MGLGVTFTGPSGDADVSKYNMYLSAVSWWKCRGRKQISSLSCQVLLSALSLLRGDAALLTAGFFFSAGQTGEDQTGLKSSGH